MYALAYFYDMHTTFPSSLSIAQQAQVLPISSVAQQAGINPGELILYGEHTAKVKPAILQRLAGRPRGKYIVVSAMSPTPLGEGKTTVAIGLTQALGTCMQANACCCIRQASMGPTFNLKGGAAGGGHSQVLPMEEFNLHLTGDIHAVSIAHNLVMAALDSRMFHESRQNDATLLKNGLATRLNINPDTINWRRVVDVCDRALRSVSIGHADAEASPAIYPRHTSVDIAVASELMAILALSFDFKDLRQRVGKVVIALNKNGIPVTLEDMQIAGAVAVLLKDAIKPNLLQTLEGQPVFVHTGPFANIAHGNSSIIADRIALQLCDYVVTESGFGSDIGLEKFVNIKCRYSGLKPDAIVLVATVRSLKMQGGGPAVKAGTKPVGVYAEENLDLLKKGLCNLGRHIQIARSFGIPVVVSINYFVTDTPTELDTIISYAKEQGAADAVVSKHYYEGGKGAAQLAAAVINAANQHSTLQFTYTDDMGIADKIRTIAKKIYRAADVQFSEQAMAQISRYEKLGFGRLPVCMAKKQYSFSHDPAHLGAPEDFILPIREMRIGTGAGFVTALTGAMNLMPGLATRPSYMHIDIDPESEVISGLS